MAGRITLWGAGEILTNFFCGGPTLPEHFYLALCVDTAPTAYVSGSELDEPTVASYARLEIPATSSYWDNAGQLQVISMNQDLDFPAATEDWGTVRYWALCNAPAGGYVYAVGVLAPEPVLTGDTMSVFAGDLSFSLGPFFTDQDS